MKMPGPAIEWQRIRTNERQAIQTALNNFFQSDKAQNVAGPDRWSLLKKVRADKVEERRAGGRGDFKKDFPGQYNQAEEDAWLKSKARLYLQGDGSGGSQAGQDDEEQLLVPRKANGKAAKSVSCGAQDDQDDDEELPKTQKRATAAKSMMCKAHDDQDDDEEIMADKTGRKAAKASTQSEITKHCYDTSTGVTKAGRPARTSTFGRSYEESDTEDENEADGSGEDEDEAAEDEQQEQPIKIVACTRGYSIIHGCAGLKIWEEEMEKAVKRNGEAKAMVITAVTPGFTPSEPKIERDGLKREAEGGDETKVVKRTKC